MKKDQNRRRFFEKILRGGLFFVIVSSLPFGKYIAKDKEKKLMRVNIHPSAVKRNK